MPVGTLASVKSLTTNQLLHLLSPQSSVLSPQIILTNTYHLMLRPGVDIAMAFDECPPHGISREEAEKSMELTHRWARRSLAARNGAAASAASLPAKAAAPALFGIVQGGVFHDLRKRSVEEICAMDF